MKNSLNKSKSMEEIKTNQNNNKIYSNSYQKRKIKSYKLLNLIQNVSNQNPNFFSNSMRPKSSIFQINYY